jgi:hypothetical protein
LGQPFYIHRDGWRASIAIVVKALYITGDHDSIVVTDYGTRFTTGLHTSDSVLNWTWPFVTIWKDGVI